MALFAATLVPSESDLKFSHFTISDKDRTLLYYNTLDDALQLIDDPNSADVITALLDLTYIKLAKDTTTPPLEWWKTYSKFTIFHPFVQMMLAIPAFSCEAEKGFSSSGFLKDKL